MLKKYLILSLILFSSTASARLFVDVSMIFKKGIDKDLVLVNEFHSQEKFLGNETLTLKMRNGLILNFTLAFVQREEDYGPSAVVEFNGILKDEQSNVLGKFEKEQLKLDEKKIYTINSEDGQLVEVVLVPKLKI